MPDPHSATATLVLTEADSVRQADKARRAEEKRQRHREYMRRWRAENRDRTHRVRVNFGDAEFKALEREARAAGMTPNHYVLEVYRAYQAGERVLSEAVQRELMELTVQIRGIANNLNQLTRHTHASEKRRGFWDRGKAEAFDPEQARAAVLAMEQRVMDFLKQVKEPPR